MSEPRWPILQWRNPMRRTTDTVGTDGHRETAQSADRLPGLSVIVSTYNMESHLAKALEAVFAMRYPAFEVIVVDDGSADGTSDVALRYPVRLIRHADNRGLAAARSRWRGRCAGKPERPPETATAADARVGPAPPAPRRCGG